MKKYDVVVKETEITRVVAQSCELIDGHVVFKSDDYHTIAIFAPKCWQSVEVIDSHVEKKEGKK